LAGKPKPFISPRDFCFTSCRIPASLARHPFQAQVFVQIDSAQDVPADAQCVRGNTYSVIVLTPLSAERTKVTYIVDMAVNGWIPNSVNEEMHHLIDSYNFQHPFAF
jgi:hypothetical protein